jgi:hypothetical protein
MYNTPRRFLLAAAVSSLIWKWNYIRGYLDGMRINKKVSGRGKPDTFLIKGERARGILKAL